MAGSPPASGISILSFDGRNIQQKISNERQERIQSVEDIWQELDKLQKAMLDMKQMMAPDRTAENTENSLDSNPGEVQSLRSELVALRAEVDRQQEELKVLRGADQQGAKKGYGLASFFTTRSEDAAVPSQVNRADDKDMSSSSLLALRVRLEAVEKHCKVAGASRWHHHVGDPVTSPIPSARKDEAAGGDLAHSILRINSLERKVKDQGQDLTTLHEGIAEVHATMSLHALRASKIAINVMEMTPDQRRKLNVEIDEKENQLGGPQRQ